MASTSTSVVAVILVLAFGSAQALAEPASGPRETVDQSYTATQPGTPTGLGFSASYHAANDPNGLPPYMRRMTFYPPPGFRYDTSVPDQCTATDLELSVNGPAACPPGSLLGKGTTSGIIYAPVTHSFEFDRYTHDVYALNNANEQILLVHSEGYTVVRGEFQPDGSLVFDSPTCFPAPPTGQCPDDYVLQLGSSTSMPVYTNSKGSYATTPPTCPAEGYWTTTVRFWWADGTSDTVAPHEPCSSA